MKLIQVAVHPGQDGSYAAFVIGLCDDGSLWSMEMGGEWERWKEPVATKAADKPAAPVAAQCPAYVDGRGMQWRCQLLAGHGGMHEWPSDAPEPTPVAEPGSGKRERARVWCEEWVCRDSGGSAWTSLTALLDDVAREAAAKALDIPEVRAWQAARDGARDTVISQLDSESEDVRYGGSTCEAFDLAARALSALAGTVKGNKP